MTKPADLRSLSELDRAQRLVDTRKELFNLRFQLATGRLDNVSRIAIVRRDIARLLTIEAEDAAALAAEDTAAIERPSRTRRSRG
jgi:large subunit ribosomal protein L29